MVHPSFGFPFFHLNTFHGKQRVLENLHFVVYSNMLIIQIFFLNLHYKIKIVIIWTRELRNSHRTTTIWN